MTTRPGNCADCNHDATHHRRASDGACNLCGCKKYHDSKHYAKLGDGTFEAIGSNSFTPADAHAAHAAMIDMKEAARKYEAKKPGSSTAESFERKAAELKAVRDKILERLPAEARLPYPDAVLRDRPG